jgi:hypothetical protein
MEENMGADGLQSYTFFALVSDFLKKKPVWPN